MRLGIRARLLLSTATLLALGLLPLLFAVTSLARESLRQSWELSAHELGRAIAGHLTEARRVRSDEELAGLLAAQLGGRIAAVGLYDERGALDHGAGEPADRAVLPSSADRSRDQTLAVATERGPAVVVLVPGQPGPVAVLIRADPEVLHTGPLVRLVALYTGLLGTGLLLVIYVVLTRLVVLPVEQLSRAARRVADGARRLDLPTSGGRELLALGASLETMTAKLTAEEEKLRTKVAELQRAKADVERAQQELVRSERLASVGRLAAGLAHEIGNPITAVLGLLELVRDGGLEPVEQRDFLDRIRSETERVNRVLRELLDFARPAVRDGQPSQPDADSHASVSHAVEQVLALLQPQKGFAALEVVSRLPAQLPEVAMHPARLQQVLLNLVMNAADAVPAEGGRICIDAELTGAHVRVGIEDNGGGVVPSVRERLFEPFVTTKEVGKGTGLGLAVCRGLLVAAGGSIELRDGAEGARFVVELPCAGHEGEPG